MSIEKENKAYSEKLLKEYELRFKYNEHLEKRRTLILGFYVIVFGFAGKYIVDSKLFTDASIAQSNSIIGFILSFTMIMLGLSTVIMQKELKRRFIENTNRLDDIAELLEIGKWTGRSGNFFSSFTSHTVFISTVMSSIWLFAMIYFLYRLW